MSTNVGKELTSGTPVVALQSLPAESSQGDVVVVQGDTGIVVRREWVGGTRNEDYFSVAFLNKGISKVVYRHNIEVDEELIPEKTEDRLGAEVGFGDVLMGDNGRKFVVHGIDHPDFGQGDKATGWEAVRFFGWAVLEGESNKGLSDHLDAYRNQIVKVYL